MKEIKIIEELNLNSPKLMPYQAVTFDGDNYYLCVESKKLVYIYDSNFNKVKFYNTKNEYRHICYDFKNKCLWALPKNMSNIIVKLNMNLQEIGCIKLPDNDNENLYFITSMSYCCSDNTVIVSTTDKILKISVLDECIREILKIENGCIKKALCVAPGFIIISEADDNYIISVYDMDFCITYQVAFKKSMTFCDAVFNPCKSSSKKDSKQNITLYLLMKDSYSRSCLYHIIIPHSSYKFKLHKCNYSICKEEEEKKKPCPELCINDFLESVALMQAALSHILNAEGEKIQKVLATTDNIDTILCVNKEVNKTIVNITHLEQVIYDSLTACCDKIIVDCPCKCKNKCECSDEENKCLCDVDGGNI